MMRKIQPQVGDLQNWGRRSSVDTYPAMEPRLAVCRAPDPRIQTVADHAIILALAFCRRLAMRRAASTNMRGLIKVESQVPQTHRLTFGIVGLGCIGIATAQLAKTFGFDICYYDPDLATKTDAMAGIVCCQTLEELLRKADVISLHCRLTREMHHLIGEREISWMKSTAFIINTASVAILEKEAVLAALRAGRLGGVGFGVTEDAAVEAFSSAEIASVPNLLIICHAAFSIVEADRDYVLASR
jgi:D-3-phosphoglycerate dehydrogenase / 2-oxoglutarate reductase